MTQVGNSVTYVDIKGNHKSTVKVVRGGKPNPEIDLTFIDDDGHEQARKSVVHRDSSPKPTSYYF